MCTIGANTVVSSNGRASTELDRPPRDAHQSAVARRRAGGPTRHPTVSKRPAPGGRGATSATADQARCRRPAQRRAPARRPVAVLLPAGVARSGRRARWGALEAADRSSRGRPGACRIGGRVQARRRHRPRDTRSPPAHTLHRAGPDHSTSPARSRAPRREARAEAASACRQGDDTAPAAQDRRRCTRVSSAGARPPPSSPRPWAAAGPPRAGKESTGMAGNRAAVRLGFGPDANPGPASSAPTGVQRGDRIVPGVHTRPGRRGPVCSTGTGSSAGYTPVGL